MIYPTMDHIYVYTYIDLKLMENLQIVVLVCFFVNFPGSLKENEATPEVKNVASVKIPISQFRIQLYSNHLFSGVLRVIYVKFRDGI